MDARDNRIKILSRSNRIYLLSFAVCFAIVAGTFNNKFSYLALAISLASIVLLNEDDAICFMMVVMSFANIFKTSPGGQSFFTYLMLFFVLWYFAKSRRIYKTLLITMALLLVYLVFQIYFSFHILRTIKFAANILFIYFALSYCTVDNIRKMFVFYIFGVVVTSSLSAFGVIPNLSDYIGLKEMMLQGEKIVRFAGMYADPNYYTINLIISLCLIVILGHKKLIGVIPSVGLSALLIFFAGMTASKSAFLMLVLPLCFLIYSKLKKRNYFVLLVVAVLSIVAVNLLFSGKIEIFNNALSRIDNAADVNSLTTGRSNIWISYCEFFLDHPVSTLFGRGFGAQLWQSHGAHNTYIDMIYYLGIVGTLLLLLVFYALIKIRKGPSKFNLLNYSVWICVAIMYFFLSELFYFDWAFHILIAICVFKMDMTKEGSFDD